MLLDTNMAERHAEIFKALGHPARLRMVAALDAGEKCVCDLQEIVGLDVSTVSRHLGVLKRAGVVSSRKDKNWAWYKLELQCFPGFLDCLTKHFKEMDTQ